MTEEIRIPFESLESWIREYCPWRTRETSHILYAYINSDKNGIVLVVPDMPLMKDNEDSEDNE